MTKKTTLSIAALLFISIAAPACDICGCGAGNSYIGILPDFYKHIFGVRYRYNALNTHLGAGGTATYLTSNEKYNIAELWGGYTFNDKLRVMVTLPYSFNERVNQGVAKNKNGISDISVAGYYQLVNTKGAAFKNKLLVQSLWVGGGIKLPTGQYNPADKSSANQNTNLFQLGTASVDYSLAAMYDLRLQDAGLNMSASYKINTGNKYNYAYGDKLSLSSQVYYKIKAGKVRLAPNAGIQYESAKKDIDNKIEVDLSGGNVLLGTLGLETNIGKVAIGTNFQAPLSQNLANGFVKASNRLMAHVAFAF